MECKVQRNISDIVNLNKCMSCGGCYAVCPVNAIKMQYNSKQGFYKPVVDEDQCIDCGRCKSLCPALNQKSDSLMGKSMTSYLAHSFDSNVRHFATSGGIINSTIRYLIEKNIVDAVLVSQYDADSPIETSACYITKETVTQLVKNPRMFASRYVCVPVLASLKELPAEIKKIAVVGTPCQISALCRYKKSGLRILFKIGITCSGGMSYKATEEYKRLQGMQDAKMFYRGDGWPGKNSLLQDGKTLEFEHSGSLYERMFTSQIFKNPGCRYCRDHFAELADMSFCDFWNVTEMQTETEGNSCMILRTVEAEKLAQQMVQERYIEIVRQLSEEEIIKTQEYVLKSKKGNLHKSLRYKLFIKTIDFIFAKGLYCHFNIEIYKKFCRFYIKMCNKMELNS